MISSENKKGIGPDKITKVKLRIQRIYSQHTDTRLDKAKRKPFNLNNLHIDSNLAEMFLSNEGKTIDQYAREVRVNKVKELLVYTSLSIEIICQNLHYSSVHTMECELLQQTGLGISFFQNLKKHKANLARQSMSKKHTKNDNCILLS